MIFEGLLLLLSASAPAKAPDAPRVPAALAAVAPAPAYKPEARAVDNWRVESALSLEMPTTAALGRAFGADPGEPPRCVKLNNYWCVKRAGWNGEIAADQDGHVAFASAEEGAAVAALLLRRYYVDYGRRSARAIAERWAPAQCGFVATRAPRPGAPASRVGMARMLPQRPLPMGLAPHGTRNNLRMRWLAMHGRGGLGGVSRRSGLGGLDLMPAPEIMEGMGEKRSAPARRAPAAAIPREKPAPPQNRKLAAAETEIAAPIAADAAPPPWAPTPPLRDCSGELVRIANYAAHIAEGVANDPLEDLKLFSSDGLPTDNLAKVLANMAAVEIGPARPRAALVAIAVAQLRRTIEDTAKAGPLNAGP